MSAEDMEALRESLQRGAQEMMARQAVQREADAVMGWTCVLACAIIAALTCACIASNIAARKHQAGLGFFLGFFFLPLGILIACVLPDATPPPLAPPPGIWQRPTPEELAFREAGRRIMRERRLERRERFERSCSNFLETIVSIPWRWGRVLEQIAGSGNDLVYRFLWGLTVTMLMAACGGLVWAIILVAR